MAATSSQSPPGLDAAVVDRLFDELFGHYGNPWIDRWASGCDDGQGRDSGMVMAKRRWAVELGPMADSPWRIDEALKPGRLPKYPPNASEFAAICRQMVDPDVGRHRRQGTPALSAAQREDRRRLLSNARVGADIPRSGTEYWQMLVDRHLAGGHVSEIALRYALEVLGPEALEGGKR